MDKLIKDDGTLTYGYHITRAPNSPRAKTIRGTDKKSPQ